MKTFEIITTTEYGKYVFLTKAQNGKLALNRLINFSCDFRNLINSQESNNMKISIKKI